MTWLVRSRSTQNPDPGHHKWHTETHTYAPPHTHLLHPSLVRHMYEKKNKTRKEKFNQQPGPYPPWLLPSPFPFFVNKLGHIYLHP